MSELIIDLTNYKDTVGARVEPGRYKVIVDDAELTKSKAGNPMVNIWLRIVGGEHDGATITDRLTITDKALFRVVAFMQAIGLQTPKKRLKLDLRHFTGKMLEVDVEDGDPYNGRIKSEVRGYIKITGAAKAAEPDDLPDTEDSVEEAEGTAPEAPEADASEAPAAVEETAEPEVIDLDALELG